MSRGIVGLRNDLEAIGAWPLLERICARHGAKPNAVLGFVDREPTTRRARREFVSLVTDTLGLSSGEASRLFGVDHSTILWNLTFIPAIRVTPKTTHDAQAAKNRKLTIPSHTAAIR